MKLGQSVLRHVNFNIHRNRCGRQIVVPVIGGVKVGLSGEQFLVEILEHFLPKVQGAFVDVGANIGQTLCKVKTVDPARAYYGFEPNACCHTYLETLVNLNDWTGVHLFPCGLSDKAEVLQLHTRAGKAMDSLGSLLPSIDPEARPGLDLAHVKTACCFAFDDLIRHIEQPVAFLKMDVEGAELEAVRGCVDSIRRSQPVIVIELMPEESLRHRRARTIDLLRSLNYEIFVITKHLNNRWLGLQPVLSDDTHGDIRATDYLMVPHDKLSMLDGVPSTS